MLRDTLLLGSDVNVPRHYRALQSPQQAELLSVAGDSIARLVNRILDELVQPLQDIQLDNSEFACLKPIVFFNPGTPLFTSQSPVVRNSAVKLKYFSQSINQSRLFQTKPI